MSQQHNTGSGISHSELLSSASAVTFPDDAQAIPPKSTPEPSSEVHISAPLPMKQHVSNQGMAGFEDINSTGIETNLPMKTLPTPDGPALVVLLSEILVSLTSPFSHNRGKQPEFDIFMHALTTDITTSQTYSPKLEDHPRWLYFSQFYQFIRSDLIVKLAIKPNMMFNQKVFVSWSPTQAAATDPFVLPGFVWDISKRKEVYVYMPWSYEHDSDTDINNGTLYCTPIGTAVGTTETSTPINVNWYIAPFTSNMSIPKPVSATTPTPPTPGFVSRDYTFATGTTSITFDSDTVMALKSTSSITTHSLSLDQGTTAFSFSLGPTTCNVSPTLLPAGTYSIIYSGAAATTVFTGYSISSTRDIRRPIVSKHESAENVEGQNLIVIPQVSDHFVHVGSISVTDVSTDLLNIDANRVAPKSLPSTISYEANRHLFYTGSPIFKVDTTDIPLDAARLLIAFAPAGVIVSNINDALQCLHCEYDVRGPPLYFKLPWMRKENKLPTGEGMCVVYAFLLEYSTTTGTDPISLHFYSNIGSIKYEHIVNFENVLPTIFKSLDVSEHQCGPTQEPSTSTPKDATELNQPGPSAMHCETDCAPPIDFDELTLGKYIHEWNHYCDPNFEDWNTTTLDILTSCVSKNYMLELANDGITRTATGLYQMSTGIFVICNTAWKTVSRFYSPDQIFKTIVQNRGIYEIPTTKQMYLLTFVEDLTKSPRLFKTLYTDGINCGLNELPKGSFEGIGFVQHAGNTCLCCYKCKTITEINEMQIYESIVACHNERFSDHAWTLHPSQLDHSVFMTDDCIDISQHQLDPIGSYGSKTSGLDTATAVTSHVASDDMLWQVVKEFTIDPTKPLVVNSIPWNPKNWPSHIRHELLRHGYFSSYPAVRITSSSSALTNGRFAIYLQHPSTSLDGTGISHTVHQVRGEPSVFNPEWKNVEQRLPIAVTDAKSPKLTIYPVELSGAATDTIKLTVWANASNIHTEFLTDPS